MDNLHDDTPQYDDSDDDEFDWEEVYVPSQPQPGSSAIVAADISTPVAPAISTIEITLESRKAKKDKEDALKKALNAAVYAERLTRVNCHKVHTVFLIANAILRNKWLNNKLLHARLMSLTPLDLQAAFLNIKKSRVPDAAYRGHIFENSIKTLVEWWAHAFFRVQKTGHIQSYTYEEIQELLKSDDYEFDEDYKLAYASFEGHEIVKSPKSLMKHALMRSGSRDVSAQLFTALCRALDIPARLVVSLQSVPWKANAGKSKPTGKKRSKPDTPADSDDVEVVVPAIRDIKGKGRATDSDGGYVFSDGSRSSTVASPSVNGKGKDKGKRKATPAVRLHKSRPKSRGSLEDDLELTSAPPTMWTEVFSRSDCCWLPVDPIRAIVNKRKVFDPAYSNLPRKGGSVRNRMLYVMAFEEDSFARDVTARYAKDYGAKVAKMQRSGGVGNSRKEWWEKIVAMVQRPYRLNRDEVEDEQLQSNQLTEGMPTTIAGFKDHPIYALARHIKQTEVIHPLAEVGKFRGESVYPRGNVLSLKTSESWMRQGYKIKEGEQPMKMIKQRAVTINKKRAVEMALADQNGDGSGEGNEGGMMQGLYAKGQTELYIPPPVVDGIIPKNNFGNIDLYAPSMLPNGAIHIPHKGTAKIARDLGVDYAEAVVSFEFKNRKAMPVLSGIVIASEHEALILEAYWQVEHHRAEKEEIKRQADVLKRWARLVKGLQIRRRLQTQYQRADTGPNLHGENRDVNVKGKPTGTQQIVVQVPTADSEPGSVLLGSHDVATPEVGGLYTGAHHDPDLFHAGGFIATADEIVQPFSLPRSQYLRPKDHAPSPPASGDDVEMVLDSEGVADEDLLTPNGYDSMRVTKDEMGYDDGRDKAPSESEMANEPMKTMTELAAEHAERQRQLELGFMKGSKLPRRSVRSSRARKKATDDESEDGLGLDGDEPFLSDYISDSPVPRKQNRSSTKRTEKAPKKRPRSPEVDGGSDVEYDGSPLSNPASTGPRRKATARATKVTTTAIRTVSGSNSTSIAVPASDRVLRSRKARA